MDAPPNPITAFAAPFLEMPTAATPPVTTPAPAPALPPLASTTATPGGGSWLPLALLAAVLFFVFRRKV